MAKHEFGGPWTEDKLERVRKYLCAYTTIFRGNPRARKLRTTYVDAFAGTGSVAPCACESEEASLFDVSGDGDAAAIKKGSARIALEVEPSFDHYLFIERNRERIEDLEGLRQEFPTKAARVEVIAGDANQELSDWCDRTDWARSRAVVFLDPYGMQVCWTLIARIAETRAVDLWLLFPLGVAVNRLLTRSRLPTQAWGDALTRILGTEEWRGLFYRERREETLFGSETVQERSVTLDDIGRFFCSRLETAFAKVAQNPLTLCNSRSAPIYLLCFAAGNPRGASTAVKIAQDILKP